MKEKFLPIGTVVLLKGGKKKIMITGYLPISKDNQSKLYDYSACLFPEGVLSSDQTAVFNHEQIAKIIQEGYSNEETIKFVGLLKEVESKQKIKEATEDIESSKKEEKTVETPKLDVKPKIEDKIEELDLPAPKKEEPIEKLEPEKPSQSSPIGVSDIKPFSE